MTNEETIKILNSLKQYYNDKNEDSYVGFDNEDNKALDMAIKALEQQKQMKKNNYIDVEELRMFIVNEIMRDGCIMFNDTIRGDDFSCKIDLIGVIVGMYELIHLLTFNEPYDYMFHWANKCGSWVETDYLKKLIDEREGRNEKN